MRLLKVLNELRMCKEGFFVPKTEPQAWKRYQVLVHQGGAEWYREQGCADQGGRSAVTAGCGKKKQRCTRQPTQMNEM